MNIFLTGGSGYLGRHLIPVLCGHGHQVTALTRSDSSAALVADLGATPVPGELTDLEVLRANAAAADAAIHLGQVFSADAQVIDLAAAQALLAGLDGRGPYVHTGGTWVFGDTDGIAEETTPHRPPRVTAWRTGNERTVLAHAETGGHPVLVMPSLVYGNGGGIIEQVFAAPGRATGAVPCVGDGGNRWSLVHVEDIAELYALALSAPAGSSYCGTLDTFPTQAEVLGAVAKSVGATVATLDPGQAEAQLGAFAEALALDQRVSGARARRELDWTPRHTDPLAELSQPTGR
ncbi:MULTISPECIES: NAD-dependent epimerase/dehydratase family protein [unclassified Crossiella]|uniref:NAD-dependent epimerase/dehydratase family protein n=1 Tax=unclassified Crossiella TaxID=2620835 RepID=UPI001FFE94DA|nr:MULTISPECIES: NAD-dependent epimerase/dehydratase family protein [unclassified Crossiella]MCK2241457.1 NAD-dependent epimerase/dehydratase family protein [Crossiella sp. S99.2]MCK2255671.1 NAD-dependent epimerase/dehydratase family protein [Crossiella sp. S99.1]